MGRLAEAHTFQMVQQDVSGPVSIFQRTSERVFDYPRSPRTNHQWNLSDVTVKANVFYNATNVPAPTVARTDFILRHSATEIIIGQQEVTYTNGFTYSLPDTFSYAYGATVHWTDILQLVVRLTMLTSDGVASIFQFSPTFASTAGLRLTGTGGPA